MKHVKTILFAALFLTLVAGCTKLELLDIAIPRYGYQQYQGVAYGPLPTQTLDIYLPETRSDSPTPVIVFFYGGSWQRGRSQDYRFVGESLAARGYITVVANYRLYPEVAFPKFVEDSAAAVAWVHEHIGAMGGDAKNLYVAGHSAGAYNAVMLALEPRYLRAAGGQIGWIRGAIGLSGPYDFLPLENPDITAIFSTASASVTQPLARVRAHTTYPPILLATGTEDTVVGPQNTRKLAARLNAVGANVTARYYTGLSHADVAQALASPFTDIAPVVPDIVAFIEKTQR